MKIFLKTFIIVFIIINLSNCQSSKERDIIGVWQLEFMDDREDSILYYFYDGTSMKVEVYKNTEWYPDGTGTYSITKEFPNFYVQIDSVDTSYVDGKWRIDKLNDNYLKLTREEWYDGETGAAFLRREFIRLQ